MPSNMDRLMQAIKKKEITNTEAAELLGIGSTTYYKLKKEWLKLHPNIEGCDKDGRMLSPDESRRNNNYE